MNNKIKKITQKNYFRENINIIVFSVFIVIFHLLFTRLFLKMDDGHFLGIINAPDFTYEGWLKYRYETVSGRTIGEFLLAFFLRHNLIFWKILNSVMIISIVHFWIKLTKLFKNELSKNSREILAIFAMFTMFVSCLNPSVFWFSGSFSYLWPFAGAVLTVSPLIFYILDGKVNTARLILSCAFALIGTMQEQSAALCTAFYLILIFIIIIKKLKLKIAMFLPLIPITVCDYFLLTCPGADGRNSIESASSFAQYNSYSVFKKLLCGLSSFFANSYYLSNFLIIIFIALLSVTIYELSKNKKLCKKLLILANTFTLFICIAVNYICAAFGHGLAHMILRNAFYKEKFTTIFYILFIGGCALTLMIFSMVLYLLKLDKKIGVTVGLCLAAGFCALMVMSFSPTVFSSGQRVAFFTNMLVITSCLVMFSNAKNSKAVNILSKCFIIYAFITISINCFAFRLIEHPLMG